MNFNKKVLQNGLTIITIPIKDSPSVTVLVVVKAGSKYETKEINGLSHFLEHMCFKGTTNRPRAALISLELDRIGSQSNAFTSQEFTGYYAKSHPSHFATILDIVSDVYQNSIFDPAEIEKEKGVIIEEINMYEDMPNALVHNVFIQAMYGDQPAGWPVSGLKENVMKMTRQNFIDYSRNHYVASATTVIVSGNFDESHIEADIEKAFAGIETTAKDTKLHIVESQSVPIIEIKQKETDQTHVIIGLRTYPASDEKNIPLTVLNTVLGGGMSSRLFQKLREEMGVGYYVRSGVDEFTDHGYLGVSTGVDKTRVKEVVKAILVELSRFTTELVTESELSKAKEYMIGNMYLSLETTDSLAEYYAIQHLLEQEMLTPDVLAEKIKNVTAKEIQTVAKEIMRDDRLVMAIVGNISDAESLKKIFHF